MPGDAPSASSEFEVGKQYLVTITNASADASVTLSFKHGDDPNWRKIQNLTDIQESTVYPIYCNGALRVDVVGSGTDPVYLSIVPLMERGY